MEAGLGITLRGCAVAGGSAECEEGAGLPLPGSAAAPGSVVPLPQRQVSLFAEPQPAPVGRESYR